MCELITILLPYGLGLLYQLSMSLAARDAEKLLILDRPLFPSLA